jgi:hypothetical protein
LTKEQTERLEDRGEYVIAVGNEDKPIPVKAIEIKKALHDGKAILLRFAEVSGKIEFDGAIKHFVFFMDTIFAGKVSFIDACFDQNAFFISAWFNDEVDFSSTRFVGNVNFYKSLFNDTVNFSSVEFDSKTNFRSVKFNRDVKFVRTKFNGELSFLGTHFSGDVSFKGAKFLSKKATFTKTRFNNTVDFSEALFGGEAHFAGAKFKGETNYNLTKFNEKAYFRKAWFDYCFFNSTLFGIKSVYSKKYLTAENILKIIGMNPDADTNNAKIIDTDEKTEKIIIEFQNSRRELSSLAYRLILAFRTGIDENRLLKTGMSINEVLPPKTMEDYPESQTVFQSATFTKIADFEKAVFLGDTDFSMARFNTVAFFKESFFFNAEALELIDKNEETKFKKNVEESDEDSGENFLVELNLDDSYFYLIKGISFNYIFPHLQRRLKKSSNNYGTVRAQLIKNYGYLYENFKKIGVFEDANEIYYQKRLLEAETENGNWMRFWNWLLDSTCKYGTDVKQVVKISFYIIVFFTLMFFLNICPLIQDYLGTIEIKDKDKWIKKEKLSEIYGRSSTRIEGFTGIITATIKHLWHAFYLSVNTFTTVGTGDIIATRFFRVLVLMEGFMGWLILGLFIIVLSAQYLH